jgi:L-fuconolactonase
MIVVDTHVHVGLRKYEPVEALLDQMNRNRVDKAVLVQYMGNPDNTYLAECMRANPGRFAGVAIVDSSKPDAPDRLARWVREDDLRGVRLNVGLLDQEGPVWSRAAELGIVVSAAGSLSALASEAFSKFVTGIPELRFRVEHMGHPDVTEGPPYPVYSRILRLADHPGATIKLSGMYSWSRLPYPYEDAYPFIRAALRAFGAERMAWGSDFPPVSAREGYRNALELGMTFPGFSVAEREWIMGRTALRIWGL